MFVGLVAGILPRASGAGSSPASTELREICNPVRVIGRDPEVEAGLRCVSVRMESPGVSQGVGFQGPRVGGGEDEGRGCHRRVRHDKPGARVNFIEVKKNESLGQNMVLWVSLGPRKVLP